MPSTVTVAGRTSGIPGTYAQFRNGSSQSVNTPTGNVLVVGEFPVLKPGEVTWCRTPAEIRAIDPADQQYARIAQTCFAALAGGSAGTPNRIGLVSAKPCTQAGTTLNDNASPQMPTVRLTSALWGERGNSITVQLTSESATTNRMAATIRAAGAGMPVEYITGIGSGILGAFRCTCSAIDTADGDTAVLTIDPSTGIVWNWLRECKGANGVAETFSVNALRVSGQITAILKQVVTAGNPLTVTVTGLDLNGDAATGTAVFTDADRVNDTAVVEADGDAVTWSQIQTITWATATSPYTAPPVLTATAFSFSSTQEPALTLVDVAAQVNEFSAFGWTVSNVAPTATQYALAVLDNNGAAGQNTRSAAVNVFANTEAFIRTINNKSGYVSATRVSGSSNKPPYPCGSAANTTLRVQLAGGTQSSATSGDYDDVLEQMLHENVQIVVGFTPVDSGIVANVQASLDAHCRAAPVTAGSGERQWFMGRHEETFDACKADVATANSQYGSLVFNKTRWVSPLGTIETVDERYFALRMGAGKAGLGIGVPLTYQRLPILGTEQPWTIGKDDEEVIAAGILAPTRDQIGYKVLRGLTTYLQGSDDVYCEQSAVESWLFSTFDVRTQINRFIGQAAVGSLNAAVLKGLVEGWLADQQAAGEITSWDSVVITQVGSRFNVAYNVVPVFPFNFAVITVTLLSA